MASLSYKCSVFVPEGSRYLRFRPGRDTFPIGFTVPDRAGLSGRDTTPVLYVLPRQPTGPYAGCAPGPPHKNPSPGWGRWDELANNKTKRRFTNVMQASRKKHDILRVNKFN